MEIPYQAEAQSSDLKHTLALLLARIATLQGQSVPWHRFSMVASTADGVELSDLSPDSQAIELWRSRFSTGEAFRASWPLTTGMTPALWIGADPNAVLPVPGMLVIRGILSSGALNCLDVQGHSHEIPAAMAERGQLVVLRSDETVSADRDETRLVTEGRSSSRRMTARQWFNHAIRKRWQVFSEGAIATLTLNVIALGASFYSMQVYDRVIPSQGYQTLWVLTFGVGMAIVLELVMRQVRSRLVDRACKAIDEELSSVFFGQALAIRMDQRPRTVGTFAAQIRHFEMVRNFMTSTTLFVIADAPFALFFVGVIALVAGPVALVPLAAIPLSIIAGMAFRKKLARLTEVHMEESNRKNGLLIEAIDGIESVKAAGAEWKMQDRWRKLTRVLAEDEIAIRDLTGLSSNLTQTLQQLSYVGLVAAGALAIGAGQLTMGGLIACTIISGRALGPIAQIASLIVQWQQAKVALKGLDAIMAMPTDVMPGERRVVPDHCRGQLRMESVRFAYGGDQPALQIDALKISPGERVAVLGPVGSGKSTLVKLLSGLYRPSEGRSFLDDVDMANLAPDFVREHVGYLSQDVRLFQGTLRENIALGLPSPTDEQILDAARITGLDKLIASHPRGLSIEISEGGRGLSGGQRQLLGLTRLVLARPRVMLLDEPTASMDPQLEELVAERVFGMRPKETTLVVVTHKLGMLKHFTRIVVVDKGRVLGDGPRDEMIARMKGAVAQAAPTSIAGKTPQTQPRATTA